MPSSEGHGKSVEAATFVPGYNHISVNHSYSDEEADNDLGNEEVDVIEIAVRPEPLTQHLASLRDVEAGLQLIELCRQGDLSAVTQRVHAGSPAGFITESGWTPVAVAAFSGFDDVLLYLLDIGADTMYETLALNRKYPLSNEHASDMKTNGNTPLHWACYKGHVDTVAILLAAGYNPEAADSAGNRCLHLACSGGHPDVVKQLLALSVAVEPRNQFENRPLDLATDPGCRRVLTRFLAQSTCEWCKENFSRLRRPSLCQHCLNAFCDTHPCSSIFTPSPQLAFAVNEANNTELDFSSHIRMRARGLRICQVCTIEMDKVEQDLRSVLEDKLELIRRAIAVLDPTVDNTFAASTSVLNGDPKDNGRNEQGYGGDEDEAGNQGEAVPNSAIEPLSEGDAFKPHHENEMGTTLHNGLETTSLSEEGLANTDDLDGERRSSISPLRRSLPSTDTILSALMLTQTDAESLNTVLEAAQLKATDRELLRVSQQTYRQLVAHVALQDEVKALLAVRPIGIRSLVKPLKRALQHATHEHVHPVMLSMALKLIQSAEAECTLFGCHALCEKIEQGSRRHSENINRLEASLAEAQRRGGSDKLLSVATALRDRLIADVRLEASLRPFQAFESSGLSPPQAAVDSSRYVFSDGTALDTLLSALEYRTQLVSTAIDMGSSVEGVSSTLLEEAMDLLKHLKKEVRDETKAQDERRKAEEEAALKAAKKSKRKKKK